MPSFYKQAIVVMGILFLMACSSVNPTPIASEQLSGSTSAPAIQEPAVTPVETQPPLPSHTASAVPSATPSPAVTPPPLGGSGVIVFGSNRDGVYTDVYLMDTSDRSVTRLTAHDTNSFPGPFSPDGSQLLFTGFGLTHSFVGLMRADGAGQVDMSGRPDTDEGFPSWSPYGQQIAFTSRMDGNNEIYLMNVDGTQIKCLTDNPADDFSPAWSPDGSLIAFVSDRDNPTGVNNLFVMNADGTNVTRLTDGDEIDYAPSWSPDGMQIAFRADIDGNGDIYLINLDGSGRLNLTDHPASDWAPAWSPDGSLIAFQTNRDGNWEIYAMPPDGSEPVNLTQHPAEDIMPYWKPVVAGIE